MAVEKETIMLLKVDLQSPGCYKKIKKILCKFPQIKDQVYDDKGNKVKITVLCCNPEKIRDKLCCKGANVIESIEIKDPPKKPTPPPPKPTPPPPKPTTPPPLYPVRTCCGQCYKGHGGGPCYSGYGVPPPCCVGYGCGRGVPPPPCYGGYGYGRDCHMSRCDYYLSEYSSCSIM